MSEVYADEMELSPELNEARDRIKKARAELESMNKEDETADIPRVVNSHGEARVEPPTTPKEAVPELPKKDNEVEKMRDEMARIKQELSRKSGEYGSELDRLQKSLKVTADQNEMLQQTLKEQKKKNKPSKEDWNVRMARYMEDIPAEERENYEQGDFKVFAKLGDQVAKDRMKKDFAKHMKEFFEENPDYAPKKGDSFDPAIAEKIERMERVTSQNEFSNRVEALAPGFIRANGNDLTGVSPDNDWAQFLDTRKDDLETWRDYCSRHVRPEAAAMAFNAFRNTKPQNESSIAGQVVPAKSNASAQVNEGPKRVYSMSEYRQFLADYNRGDFNDSEESRLKAVARMENYRQAAMEGRLQ